MRIHTLEKPYQCPHCEKKYSQHSQLVIHIRSHTGEKPFICSICNKGFTCSKVLKNHARTHTGEKPFECEFCHRGFAAYCNLIVHRRTHTKERPYVCRLCGKAFEHSGNLSRHIRGHQVDHGIRCIPCGQVFTQESDLIEHTVSEHPSEIESSDNLQSNSSLENDNNFRSNSQEMHERYSQDEDTEVVVNNTGQDDSPDELLTIDSSSISMTTGTADKESEPTILSPESHDRNSSEPLSDSSDDANTERFTKEQRRKRHRNENQAKMKSQRLSNSSSNFMSSRITEEYSQELTNIENDGEKIVFKKNISPCKSGIKLTISNLTSSKQSPAIKYKNMSFPSEEDCDVSESSVLNSHRAKFPLEVSNTVSNYSEHSREFDQNEDQTSDEESPALDLSSKSVMDFKAKYEKNHTRCHDGDIQFIDESTVDPHDRNPPTIVPQQQSKKKKSIRCMMTKKAPPELIPLNQQSCKAKDFVVENNDTHKPDTNTEAISVHEVDNKLLIVKKCDENVSFQSKRESLINDNAYLQTIHNSQLPKTNSDMTNRLTNLSKNIERSYGAEENAATQSYESQTSSLSFADRLNHKNLNPVSLQNGYDTSHIPFSLDNMKQEIRQSLLSMAAGNRDHQTSFKSKAESVIISIIGGERITYFGFPGKTVEQVSYITPYSY